MWGIKLGATIVSVIVGVLFGFFAIGNLFWLGFGFLEQLNPERDRINESPNLLNYLVVSIVLGVAAWFLTNWLPPRLMRPSNLHPKVLARLAKRD